MSAISTQGGGPMTQQHTVTVGPMTRFGLTPAGCTCGLRWSNVSYDGGDGNRQSGALLRHVRATGGKFTPTR